MAKEAQPIRVFPGKNQTVEIVANGQIIIINLRRRLTGKEFLVRQIDISDKEKERLLWSQEYEAALLKWFEARKTEVAITGLRAEYIDSLDEEKLLREILTNGRNLGFSDKNILRTGRSLILQRMNVAEEKMEQIPAVVNGRLTELHEMIRETWRGPLLQNSRKQVK